jgi:hypothetical protein
MNGSTRKFLLAAVLVTAFTRAFAYGQLAFVGIVRELA